MNRLFCACLLFRVLNFCPRIKPQGKNNTGPKAGVIFLKGNLEAFFVYSSDFVRGWRAMATVPVRTMLLMP